MVLYTTYMQMYVVGIIQYVYKPCELHEIGKNDFFSHLESAIGQCEVFLRLTFILALVGPVPDIITDKSPSKITSCCN